MNLLKHQVPPQGDWRIWLLLTDRAEGKTVAMANCMFELADTIGGRGVVISVANMSSDRFLQTASNQRVIEHSALKRQIYINAGRGKVGVDLVEYQSISRDPFRWQGFVYDWVVIDNLTDMRDYYKVFDFCVHILGRRSLKIAISATPVCEKELGWIMRKPNVTVTSTFDHQAYLEEIEKIYENLP
jgi:phage terminase large subunit-like protein